MHACAARNRTARTGSSHPPRRCRPPPERDRLSVALRNCDDSALMRAFHLAVFGILAAGLASAAGYLWAPLVSPKFEALHLSAPPIESRLIEPPLRIRPADLLAPTVRPLLPLHVAGTVHVVARRLDVVPAPRPVRVVAPQVPVPAPITATPAPVVAVAHQPPPPATPHHAAAPPTAAPKASLPPVVVKPPPPVEHEVQPVLPKPAPALGSPAPPAVLAPVPTPAPTPSPQPVPLPVTTTPDPPADASAQPATIAAPAAPAVPVTPPVATPPPATTATPPPATTTPAPVTQPPPPTTTTPTPTPAPRDGDDDEDDDSGHHHDSARPGWGCGDQNHDHTGPPGHSSPC